MSLILDPDGMTRKVYEGLPDDMKTQNTKALLFGIFNRIACDIHKAHFVYLKEKMEREENK